MKPPARFQYNPLVSTFTYYAAFIIIGIAMALIGPSLSRLAQLTSSRLDQISIIFVSGSLGYMTGSRLGGRGYDRFQGHHIQAISLLLLALTAILVPLLHSLWLLVVTLFLMGILEGTVDVGGNTLLTWIHGEKIGPFMNSLHFFFGVGSFIAPLIIARVMMVSEDIQWAFWILALLTLPLAAWTWFLPSPPVRRKETGTSGQQRPSHGPFVLIVLFFVFAVGVEAGFGNWIHTYSLRSNLANEIQAAYLTSAFWGAFMIGRLLGVGISSRLRPPTILVIDLSGCLVAFSILLTGPTSELALWAGAILLGLSIASVFATGMAFTEQVLRLTGNLVGWILMGAGIGGMVFPWLIGQLFETIGPQVTMPVLLASNLVAICLLLFLIFHSRKQGSRT